MMVNPKTDMSPAVDSAPARSDRRARRLNPLVDRKAASLKAMLQAATVRMPAMRMFSLASIVQQIARLSANAQGPDTPRLPWPTWAADADEALVDEDCSKVLLLALEMRVMHVEHFADEDECVWLYRLRQAIDACSLNPRIWAAIKDRPRQRHRHNAVLAAEATRSAAARAAALLSRLDVQLNADRRQQQRLAQQIARQSQARMRSRSGVKSPSASHEQTGVAA